MLHFGVGLEESYRSGGKWRPASGKSTLSSQKLRNCLALRFSLYCTKAQAKSKQRNLGARICCLVSAQQQLYQAPSIVFLVEMVLKSWNPHHQSQSMHLTLGTSSSTLGKKVILSQFKFYLWSSFFFFFF